MLPFPVPDGAAMTTIRPASAVERPQQRGALLGAEAPKAPGLADPDLLHEPPGLDLAEAGEGLEDGKHLHLADDLVPVGLVEQLAQGDGAHLELLLELRSHAAG